MAAGEALATLEFEYNNEKVIATIPNSLANEIKSLSKSDPGKFGEILRDIYLSQHSEQNNISMIHQNNLSSESQRGQICGQRNQECPPCNQRDIQSKSSGMENSQSASQEKVHIWTEEQEKLLIEIRFEQEARFQANKSHDTLWNGICSTLNNRGINVTRQQLINKWKNLKKTLQGNSGS